MLLAPRAIISSSASTAIPSPIANNQITLATPMKTPRAVSIDLIGWVAMLIKAVFHKVLARPALWS